ncbi:acyl-CoA dehydrogenase [Ophiocordyceps camponoti-floridani]|uniref:Acyl-CoA dehydrogenase n=1 Tax=Ophiocordyceps camponoti-floridani TaxID=2030778 RepID=A0A8H4Q8F4_9HYPO|nr:acyl-CoA dehydrogenase [Ophiocordyceps camponoti-floridani]
MAWNMLMPRRLKPIKHVIVHLTSLRTSSSLTTPFLQDEADDDLTPSQQKVRHAIHRICTRFPDTYWHDQERHQRFPIEHVQALAEAGWLGICIPARYGGLGHGLSEAVVMMQTVAECGGGGMAAASSVHVNIFGLEPVIRVGTEAQKRRFLMPLAGGRETACFAVTEPDAGLDTLSLKSKAVKRGDGYLLSGEKVWISAARRADRMLVLVRTEHGADGLTLFYADLGTGISTGAVSMTEIPRMGRAAVDSNAIRFTDWAIPSGDVIGEPGKGFRTLLPSLNAERILLASEALGLGRAALRKAAQANRCRRGQSVQHSLADAWIRLEAARGAVAVAAARWDAGMGEGVRANAVKYLAAEAAFGAFGRWF